MITYMFCCLLWTPSLAVPNKPLEPAARGERTAGGFSDEYLTDSSRVVDWGRRLRCPVCQGVPILDSPAEMAQAMMRRLRELVAQGKSDGEIRTYFVARYGEWVLLEPPLSAITIWLYLLPLLALLLGLLWLWRHPRAKA